MKKIDFKSPKYVLPLIILPFVFIINYVVLDMFKPNEAQAATIELKETDNIITELPDANLNKRGINDKFSAGVEQHKYRTDYSAVRELDQDKNSKVDYGSVYSAEERRMLDSMNAAILTEKPNSNFTERVEQRQAQDRQRYAATTPATRSKPVKAESQYEKEMRLFKEQMKYIDSLDRASREPTPRYEQQPIAAVQQPIQVHEEDSAEEVRKSTNPNITYFNTVTDKKEDQFIKAILDEGLKVRQGGRIRVRLLDDIFVSDYEIKKGSYLYGTVKGFTAQRVEISITSILYSNQIIPVNLSIYDNDGISGLYVPASQFREFTKELAANTANGQRITFNQDPQGANQMLFQMMDRMVQTTTRAAGKAIKQNKAILKYNTTVFLIDNKAKN